MTRIAAFIQRVIVTQAMRDESTEHYRRTVEAYTQSTGVR